MDRAPRQVEIIPPGHAPRPAPPRAEPFSGGRSAVAENGITRALRMIGVGATVVGAVALTMAFGALMMALAAALVPIAVAGGLFMAWKYRRMLRKQGPEAYSKFVFFRKVFFSGGGRGPKRDARENDGEGDFRDFFQR